MHGLEDSPKKYKYVESLEEGLLQLVTSIISGWLSKGVLPSYCCKLRLLAVLTKSSTLAFFRSSSTPISAIKSTNICGCFGKDKKIKTQNSPFIIALLMKNEEKKNNHLAWLARLFSRSRTPRYLRPQSLAGGS